MLSVIQRPLLSTLPGYSGSNPEIINEFEAKWNESLDELFAKILPFGAEPDQFFTNHFKKEKLLSYTFEITRKDSRNDLASITFVINKKANLTSIKLLIKEIIERLNSNKLLSIELLNSNLNNITEAINKESKLKIGSFIFDINYFLKSNKQKLTDVRKRRGGIV